MAGWGLTVAINKGLKIDKARIFLEYRVEKAEVVKSVYSRLIQVAKSEWGLNERTCKLVYKAVFVPMMAYGASVWAEKSLCKVHPKRRILAAQRIPLISITKAYRTTSTDALTILAGVLLLDLELLNIAKSERERVAVRSKNDDRSSNETRDNCI